MSISAGPDRRRPRRAARSSSGSARARRRRPPGSPSASATTRRSSSRRATAPEVITTDALVEGVHFDRRVRARRGHRPQGAGGQPERPGRDGRRAPGRAAVAGAARPRCAWPTSTRCWTGWLALAGAPRRDAGRRQHLAVARPAGRRRHGASGRVKPRRVLTRGGARPGDGDLRQRQRSAPPAPGSRWRCGAGVAAGEDGLARVPGALPAARAPGAARPAPRPEPRSRRPAST